MTEQRLLDGVLLDRTVTSTCNRA